MFRFALPSALPADSLFALSTLQVYHNDTIPDIGANGTLISRKPNQYHTSSAHKDHSVYRSVGVSTNNGNNTDFGKIAVGSINDTSFSFLTLSRDAVQFRVTADKQPLSSTPFRFTDVHLPLDSLQLRIRFQPDVAGAATARTVIVRERYGTLRRRYHLVPLYSERRRNPPTTGHRKYDQQIEF